MKEKNIDDFVKQEDVEKYGEIEALHIAGRRYLIYQEEQRIKKTGRLILLFIIIILTAISTITYFN